MRNMMTFAALATVALLLAGCGGSPKDAPARAPAVTVVIRSFKYRPATLTVKAGTRVTWRNDDSSPHTATARGGGFTTRVLARGESRTLTVTSAGRFAYVCVFHAFMRGTLIVTSR